MPNGFRFALVCVLLGCASAQADYPFGRVFTTPEQRRQLDLFRATGEPQLQKSSPAGTAAGAESQVTQTDSVRFSGYMLRSDGSQMLWVDGASELSGRANGNAGSSHGPVNSRDGKVVFRARDEQARLKPGQVWMLNEDSVAEAYEAPDASAAAAIKDEPVDSE